MDTGRVPVRLLVNGETAEVAVVVRTSATEALREELHVSGSGRGCDHEHFGLPLRLDRLPGMP